MGRIYRVRPKDSEPRPIPRLDQMSAVDNKLDGEWDGARIGDRSTGTTRRFVQYAVEEFVNEQATRDALHAAGSL